MEKRTAKNYNCNKDSINQITTVLQVKFSRKKSGIQTLGK